MTKIVIPDVFGLGECPLWDEITARLFWTSIRDGEIHALDPETGEREKWSFDGPVGSFGFCADGRFIVALRDSLVLFDPRTHASELLASIPHARREMRLNDGRVGPDCAFWVGSMDERSDMEPLGKLYRVAPDGTVTTIREGLKISNGLAWSPGGTILYHADTRGPWIEAWDVDPISGAVSNRRRFAELDDVIGRPDGAACDVDGHYWSAGPSAAKLNRFAPDGRLVFSVPMPNGRPTMPCFGGRDRRTVFVTSLSDGVEPQLFQRFPDLGRLLSWRAPVAGLPEYRFGARNQTGRSRTDPTPPRRIRSDYKSRPPSGSARPASGVDPDDPTARSSSSAIV